MKFYRGLYVGESIRKVNKVKWKLSIGAGQFGVYVIALACNRDQLDIFHCAMLRQKHFDRRSLRVVGLAGSMDEAFGLVERMARDAWEDGMEGDIRGYLQKRMGPAKGGSG
ncbi:MAG: hypothetical protein Q4C65_00485 [Eubacteriales bacterium]|nr:hypothetical protein [Eubacteriales bacterium]